MAQEQETQRQEQGQETSTGMQASEGQQRTDALERTSRTAFATPEWSSPFGAIRRLMDDMDRLFSDFGFGMPSLLREAFGPLETIGRRFWAPVIETFERDGRLVLRADLPGLRREDVNVEIVGDELVVSGERKEEKEEEEKARGGRRYTERRYGSFERRMTLPAGAEPETIEASFDDGVLEVSLAVPGRESRKIEVKSRSEKESGQPGSIH